MDETTLKISIAAFFHDIGKFVGREMLNISREEFDLKASDFLPVRNGRYSHHHALYTAEFIEKFKDVLPEEFDRPWGVGDGLVKLAASHHNPASPMEWIIAEADRISSGMDREEFDAYENEGISVSDYEKTRLIPVLETLDIDGGRKLSNREEYKHAYRLAEMTPETIFPLPVESVVPKDKNTAKAEYAELCNRFVTSLKTLQHKSQISLWYEHFESLAMRYLSQMPAARVGNVIPDVSLYDHLKTTAALAASLYLFHDSTETLNVEAVKQGDTDKFLLISGDFHGIQNFIFSGYGDTQKYRSKLLRGRSFYVSVLSELTAHLLCLNIGLPSASVVLNAGGKFTIIAPKTDHAEESVRTVQHQIDRWLSDLTFGETCISLSAVNASPNDFRSGGFPRLQDQMARNMLERKLCRIDLDEFGGVVENYFDSKQASLCPFCGKRPADDSVVMPDEQPACRLCRDHVFIGENLVKKNVMAILGKSPLLQKRGLMEPVFGKFQIIFPDDGMESAADKGELLKYWKLKVDEKNPANNDAAFKFFRGYIPVYTTADLENENIVSDSRKVEGEAFFDPVREGEPKTMNHIAAAARVVSKEGKSSGVEALGVLKADVDHLGLLMACGLKENLYSISRLATMSRQLNNFFAVYLPWFLETNEFYSDVYTVFAGGDDLLLIGPWNKVASLAPVLSERFNAYVCNADIHFSAGISIHKAHTPVDVMAEASEAAVIRSKESGRNRMTLFDETVTWEEAKELSEVESAMVKWLEEGYLGNSMFYRLNAFIEMADRESRLVTGNSSINIRDMDCTRWRSLLSYSVERNIGKSSNPEERKRRVNVVREKLAEWLATWHGKLRIPLWSIQYNRR